MNDISSAQFIFFDLDGTLTKSRTKIDPEHAKTFSKLLDLKKVGVISGADFPQYNIQLLDHLPRETNLKHLTLFPTNGARCLVYNNDSWKEQYAHTLTPNEMERVTKAFNDTLEKIGLDTKEVSGKQIENRGEQITFSGIGQDAPLDKKDLWDPDHEKREVVVEHLKKQIPEMDIKIAGTTSIDVMKRGINKAFAVREASKLFNIPIEDMIYIGDSLFPGGNDAIVRTTGITIVSTSGPEETHRLIEESFPS